MNRNINDFIQEIRNIKQTEFDSQESNNELNSELNSEPKEIKELDKLTEAKTNERVEHYNSRKEIRKSIGKASVWLIYAFAIFAIIITCIYIGCMAIEPIWQPAVKIKENFETLFFKMFDLLPWILLFIFGDLKKLNEAITEATANP